MAVSLILGPSPLKSSSLEDGEATEPFAATSEGQGAGLPTASRRSGVTSHEGQRGPPVLVATVVLGTPPPPSGYSLSRPTAPRREAGATGVCMFPSDLCTTPNRWSRCFLWLPHTRERMFILRYFSFPMRRRGRSLFINEYFGANLT